jgi:hypothetical protein
LYQQAVQRAGEQNLRIVYHGPLAKAQFGAKSASDAKLDRNGSRQIVIVRSDSQDKALLADLLSQGNFVIAVGGAKVNAAKSAFALVTDIAHSGKRTRPLASYDHKQPRLRQINSDGSRNVGGGEETVSAFYFSPAGSHSFHSTEQDVNRGMAAAVEWAKGIAVEAEAKGSARAGAKADADFTRMYTRTVDNTCRHPSDGNVGRLSLRIEYSRYNTRTTSSALWTVKYLAQMVPLTTGSAMYRNEQLKMSSALRPYTNTIHLRDYEPTTTQGSATKAVDLSGSFGGISAARNWSYSAPDVQILDNNSLAEHKTGWTHNINKSTPSGSNTVKFAPGALVGTGRNTLLYDMVNENYSVTWRRPNTILGQGRGQTCNYAYTD